MGAAPGQGAPSPWQRHRLGGEMSRWGDSGRRGRGEEAGLTCGRTLVCLYQAQRMRPAIVTGPVT